MLLSYWQFWLKNCHFSTSSCKGFIVSLRSWIGSVSGCFWLLSTSSKINEQTFQEKTQFCSFILTSFNWALLRTLTNFTKKFVKYVWPGLKNGSVFTSLCIVLFENWNFFLTSSEFAEQDIDRKIFIIFERYWRLP